MSHWPQHNAKDETIEDYDGIPQSDDDDDDDDDDEPRNTFAGYTSRYDWTDEEDEDEEDGDSDSDSQYSREVEALQLTQGRGLGGEKAKPRKLIVCIDGTGNAFGRQTTNVLEVYGMLAKDDEQLSFYRNGIGTYVNESHFSLYSLFLVLKSSLEMAFAWNVDGTIKDAYRWLVQNYREGDKIYLFGFSRGAYQVRALSGMLGTVGLLTKEGENSIPLAYSLYMEQKQEKKDKDLKNSKEKELKAQSTETKVERSFTLKQYTLFFLFLCACILQAVFLGSRMVSKGLWLWLVTWVVAISMLLLCILVAVLVEDNQPQKDFKLGPQSKDTNGSTDPRPDDTNIKKPQVGDDDADEIPEPPSPDSPTGHEFQMTAFNTGMAGAQSTESDNDPIVKLRHFKETFGPKKVEIEFMGCWDTVSSIGPPWARQPTLLEPFDHVKAFRHALALDERRIAFRPKYVGYEERMQHCKVLEREEDNQDFDADGKSEAGSDFESNMEPKIKEVWFPGAHSDVGGNHHSSHSEDRRFCNPALDWMMDEAEDSGLVFKDKENLSAGSTVRVSDSLTLGWLILEMLPWRKIDHKTGEDTLILKPRRDPGRLVLPGQRIHVSAIMRHYRPLARLQKGLSMRKVWREKAPSNQTVVKAVPNEDARKDKTTKNGVKLEDTKITELELEISEWWSRSPGAYRLHRSNSVGVEKTVGEVSMRELRRLTSLLWIPVVLEAVHSACGFLFSTKVSLLGHIHDLFSLLILTILARLTCKVFRLDASLHVVLKKWLGVETSLIYGVNNRLLALGIIVLTRTSLAVFTTLDRLRKWWYLHSQNSKSPR